MEFEWDESKNQINLNKHKIDFNDAVHVFIDPNRVERYDSANSFNEDRWQTIGMAPLGVLFVVYAERRDGNVIRLISARKATRREQEAYRNGRF